MAHTWAFDAAETTPYIQVTAPTKRAGKSRLLEVLSLLVRCPLFTGHISAAALVRRIEADRPTLLLDEIDATFSGNPELRETLRGVLNSGHRVGGRYTVCAGKGASLEVRDYSTYCAKAFAGIGDLPDTVADRCVRIELKRKLRSERVERFRRRAAGREAADITERLGAWADASLGRLESARPEIPEQLEDRAADSWEPLLAIADAAGKEWPQRGRAAAVELSRRTGVEDSSAGEQLLADIRRVFEDGRGDWIPTKELIGALCEIDDAPWATWRRGEPITPHSVARLLRPFGICAQRAWEDHRDSRGYRRATLEDAWTRYASADSPDG